MGPQFGDPDDPTIRFIRWKAVRLGGRGVFAGYDAQDLQQDMWLKCWEASRRFDGSRSCLRTFLERAIDNLIASMMEARRAACRDFGRCRLSLSDPAASTSGDPAEFGDLVSDDAYRMRFGLTSLSSYERTELEVDVERIIATLPRELAVIATQLKSLSVVETVHLLGIPRATLYRRIADIRDMFEVAGLCNYLMRNASNGRNGRFTQPKVACTPTAVSLDGSRHAVRIVRNCVKSKTRRRTLGARPLDCVCENQQPEGSR